MTVRDDLLAAYALIQDEARWCTGTFHDPHGRRCLHGALLASSGDSGSLAAEEAAEDAAFDLFEANDFSVINDCYGHRAATMVLRHAILREEGLA